MWRLAIYTFVCVCLCAYFIITRQHFYNILQYLPNYVFQIMFSATVFLLWIYMLMRSIAYNVFIVYRPRPIRRWNEKKCTRIYFLASFLAISLLHITQIEMLFEMKGHTVFSSGYMTGGVFFFWAILLIHLWLMYKRPHWDLLNFLIWSLFKEGFTWAEKNMTGNRDSTTAAPEDKEDDEQPAVIAVSAIDDPAPHSRTDKMRRFKENRIQVYDILLLYFSKKEGSYFVDTKGNRVYCRCTSSILKTWKVKPWFVKVNSKVYLNMWYFSESKKMIGAVALDDHILEKVWQPIIDWGGDLHQLIQVSYRCKKNVRQHFEHRDRLDNTGWDGYFYYE